MLFGSYRFHCRLVSNAKMPVFKGATFRGFFGHALKNVACSMNNSACKRCRLKKTCLYSLLFEKVASEKNSNGSNPRPFAMVPPLETQTHYKKDERFFFDLLLFGDINHNLPYLIYAIEKVAALDNSLGIGDRIKGRRAKFVLESVDSNNLRIYTCQEKFIAGINSASMLKLPTPLPSNSQVARLKVRLITQLRRSSEIFNLDLPFHELIRFALRRISGLFNKFGGGEPKLDYSGMVQRAKKVEAFQNKLEKYDPPRRSSRQKDQDLRIGGIKGEISYKDVPGKFLPLLEFVKTTHLGKQTAFGLGKIELEYDTNK